MRFESFTFVTSHASSSPYVISPGGPVPLQRVHHARVKKRVKRVVFHGRTMYARTLKRVSKSPKSGKKGIVLTEGLLQKGIF